MITCSRPIDPCMIEIWRVSSPSIGHQGWTVRCGLTTSPPSGGIWGRSELQTAILLPPPPRANWTAVAACSRTVLTLPPLPSLTPTDTVIRFSDAAALSRSATASRSVVLAKATTTPSARTAAKPTALCASLNKASADVSSPTARITAGSSRSPSPINRRKRISQALIQGRIGRPSSLTRIIPTRAFPAPRRTNGILLTRLHR